MKKTTHSTRFIVLLLMGSLLFLGSCIEITETISIRKNKSGSVTYSLQSQDGGSLFSSLTSMFSMSLEDQVRVEADKLIRELLKQPGISNVSYNLRGRSGSYYLTFDFSDYKSFNQALYAISGNKKSVFTPGYFRITNNKFKKINFSPWLKKYMERESIEIPSPLISEMIYFKSEVEVPDAIRKLQPSATAKKRNDRQSVQRFKLSEILDNKVDTGIKIRY